MTDPAVTSDNPSAAAPAISAPSAAPAASPAPAAAEPPPTLRRRAYRMWLWVRPIVVIIVALGAFRTTVADWHDVPTGSMEPSIEPGDRIVVNNLAYQLQMPFLGWHLVEWSNPQRGDVIVCYSPANGQRLVKRVIGVPGDVIALRDNQLFINGQTVPLHWDTTQSGTEELSPGHLHAVQQMPALPARRSFAPVTVPAGQFFVMGDNRDNSLDSRYFGFVPRSQIVGKAFGIAFSLDPEHHKAPRWKRFFHGLP